MSGRRRIAFVTDYDARDVRTFSGVGHFIARALERDVGEVDYLDVSILPRPIERRRPYWQLSQRAVLRMGRTATVAVKAGRYDLVFCPGSLPIAGLEADIPIVLWKDATFASLAETYFLDLSGRTMRDGERMERAALERASLMLFASDWGAREAIAAYHLDPVKVRVIPWGANLDVDPGRQAANRGPSKPLELLFVGRPWARKNGRVALAVVDELRRRDVAAHLTVVGSSPPELGAVADAVTVHPFLDKRVSEQRAQLDRLYRDADFLLFPSLHESYGVVLCEAAAYGVPALASDVGGIPTIVADGESGFLLPADAGADAYADRILTAVAGPYRELRAHARRRYESFLNWDTAGRAVAAALAEHGL